VFIPAWNEEENLPDVLDELREVLPAADVLVIDDGSTDGTAEVAREGGAHVLSFSENRGLGEGIAAGYRTALERGYAICGRVDADGQHPAAELSRLIDAVRAGRCDVAIGSRYTTGDGYEPNRYKLVGPRRFGTAVMRRAMRPLLGRVVGDPMSGMYAVNAKAMPVLAVPFDGERLTATGTPVELLDGVEADEGFALSATGTLVFQPQPPAAHRKLVWADRSGVTTQIPI
jgi:glycosyltransferase involved in cell wall biosynthesis